MKIEGRLLPPRRWSRDSPPPPADGGHRPPTVPMTLMSQSTRRVFRSPCQAARLLQRERHRRDHQVLSERRRCAGLGRRRRLAGRLDRLAAGDHGLGQVRTDAGRHDDEGRPQHQAHHEKGRPEGQQPPAALLSDPIGSVPNSTWSQVLFACAKHFKVDPGKMKVVPLDPPVTRQSLRSGEVASGTTDSSPDMDLVNDKANYEVVCDGAIAGTSVIDPWIVTKKFATENPAAAARFVEAGFRANEPIMKDREKAVASARVLQGRRHRRQRGQGALHAQYATIRPSTRRWPTCARGRASGRSPRRRSLRGGRGLRQGARPGRRDEGRAADPRGGESCASSRPSPSHPGSQGRDREQPELPDDRHRLPRAERLPGRQVARPMAGPREMIIRIGACGICASDCKCWSGAQMFWGPDSPG